MPKRQLSSSERKVHASASGGVLRNRRRGRRQRTLSTYHTMHLVLRAAWGRGAWSLSLTKHRQMINQVLAKHSARAGVRLLSTGNAGNHLHLRVQIPSRKQYCSFIRSVAGEIALKMKRRMEEFYGEKQGPFWERRPFSSIIAGAKYVARVVDYLKINVLEGEGYSRASARLKVYRWRDLNQIRIL